MEEGPTCPSMANSAAAAGGGGGQQWLFEGRPEQQDQLDEAMRVFAERGHHGLVHRVFLILQQRQLDEAMRVLNDDGDEEHEDGFADWLLREFRRRLNGNVFLMLDAGYDEHETFRVLHQLALMASRETAGFLGVGAVLEKRTFHGAGGDGGGGVTECSICFGDFVDGEEVSVMPCPSRGHAFHPECITKWLGISSTCPLCRHGLAC